MELSSSLRRYSLRNLLPWVISAGLFLVCLAFYSRHNSFPYYYHTDEPAKVRQIVKEDRNFHHPLLMLSATDGVMRALRIERKKQCAVIAGRWCNAVFSAISVVALALLGYHYRGPFAAMAVGLIVGLHFELIELSHFFKEEPALLVGFSLSFLAMAFVWQHPSIINVCLLGCAAGLATSGKYIGVVALIPAALIAARVPLRDERQSRARVFAVLFTAFFLTLGAVNFPLLSHFADFREGLGRELVILKTGHRGVSRNVSHFHWIASYLHSMAYPAVFFLTWHLLRQWRRRKEVTVPECIFCVFPFAYAVMLSFSTKDGGRYLLPVVVMSNYLAGLGVVDVAEYVSRRLAHRKAALFACLAGVALVFIQEAPRIAGVMNGFTKDNRGDLISYINGELPQNAVLAVERRVRMPDPTVSTFDEVSLAVKQRLISTPLLADLGSIEEMKQQGITHVVIAKSVYGKFVDEDRVVHASAREEYDRRRAFYRRLAKEGKLIWERKGDDVGSLNPALELYQLPPMAVIP